MLYWIELISEHVTNLFILPLLDGPHQIDKLLYSKPVELNEAIPNNPKTHSDQARTIEVISSFKS